MMKINILIVFIFLNLVSNSFSSEKSVEVSVVTKWTSTPLLLEASEFVADTSPLNFWWFIDTFAELPSEVSSSDQSVYNYLIQELEASEKFTSDELALLKFSLAIRKYSARIQMYASLLEDHAADKSWKAGGCPSSPDVFAEVNGQLICTLDAIKSARSHYTDQDAPTYPFDHIHPDSPLPRHGPLLILYGRLGSPDFARWHSYILGTDDNSYEIGTEKLRYVFRHLWSSTSSPDQAGFKPIRLQGYGVELAIKSNEYKAFDDSAKTSPNESPQRSSVGDASTNDSANNNDELDVNGFYFGKLKELNPSLSTELDLFKDQLISELGSTTLEIHELQNLGIQASMRILEASDPLKLLRDISQNFPNLANSLAKLPMDGATAFNQELLLNRAAGIPEGQSYLLVNGRVIDTASLSPFALLSALQSEMNLISAFEQFGLTSSSMQYLMIRGSPNARAASHSRIDIRHKEMIYLNDIASDERFTKLPESFSSFLSRATYPGMQSMMKWYRGNAYNMIYVVDIATHDGLTNLDQVANLMKQGIPVRFGVLLTITDPAQRACSMATSIAIHLHEIQGLEGFNSFVKGLTASWRDHLTSVSDKHAAVDHANENCVPMEVVESGLASVIGKKKAKKMIEKLSTDQEHLLRVLEVSDHTELLGIKAKSPCIIANGELYPVFTSQEGLSEMLGQMMQHITTYVGAGELTDDSDLDSFWYEGSRAYSRWSPIIWAPKADTSFVRLTGSGMDDLASSVPYISNHLLLSSSNPEAAITHWIIADPLDEDHGGRHLFVSAISYITNKRFGSSPTRLGLLIHPAPICNALPHSHLVHRIIEALFKYYGDQPEVLAAKYWEVIDAPKVLADFYLDGDPQEWAEVYNSMHMNLDGAAAATGAGFDSLEHSIQEKLEPWKVWLERRSSFPDEVIDELLTLAELPYEESPLVKKVVQMSKSAFGIRRGVPAIITNGRRITFETLEAARSFSPLDFNALEAYEANERSLPILSLLNNSLTFKAETPTSDPRWRSDFIMKATSVVGSDWASSVQRFELDPEMHFDKTSIVYERGSSFEILAIINPLSTHAQKVAPLLIHLRDTFDFNLQIVLNPQSSISELPLEKYYRYVVNTEVSFDADGSMSAGPTAIFSHLPDTYTLTVGLDTPASWLVEPSVADYDLDNIRMSELEPGERLRAGYSLKALLVEGSCTDQTKGTEHGLVPPQGLQLELAHALNNKTAIDPHALTDTLVLANGGYFQLKSEPGVSCLRIKSSTRSSQIYHLHSPIGDSEAAPPVLLDQIVDRTCFAVDSLDGVQINKLHVSKKHGMEAESVLVVDEPGSDEAGSNGSWLSSLFGMGGDSVESPDEQGSDERNDGLVVKKKTINVFSVASGHLYERLLRIMMLSVMKHTDSPVKFWLIENFLSPKFREFIPVMAEEYGFEYELVTYKWPSWLRYQSQKQRLIWGYKILFLDVLFPLDVEKVIFVDADQIVRADLKELNDLNLQGKTIAMTPFCDSRTEMEGYRFWKTGFWKTHLGETPYHISALFVVDLARFRAQAQGDIMRSVYEGLTRDPNSLANLDQDLPNYLQTHFPMYSLPQEWLYCETWCSDEEKEAAKTIDLCNNPLTKASKLDNARRIVPEWNDYDAEIATLFAKSSASKE